MGGVIVLDLFSWHTFRRIISQTVLRSLGFGLPFRTSGSQSDLFCACGWKYIALEYWGSSALHKDVWDTYPHDSTGQDTLTLGAGQPVDGDLWSQWVLLQGRFRQIRWLSTDNSNSFLWHWDIFCCLLRLCHRPRKTELAGATEEGIKEKRYPCSLPHGCHASNPMAATERFPCRCPRCPELSPSHGQSGCQPLGLRLCLCQWNALMYPFKSKYLHTVLPCAMYMAQICLEGALLCNVKMCPQRHKELTQCNFPNKTKGSA